MADDFGSRAFGSLGWRTRMLGKLRLDGPLMVGLALIALYGQIVLYYNNIITIL